MDRLYLVVGKNYEAFAKSASALTMEGVRAKLPELDSSDVIVIGQGVAHSERAELSALVRAQERPPALLCCDSPALPKQTHKRSVDHVLIGDMVRVSRHTYSCPLLASSGFDRLADHVTGQHLNGMLLIESARQASISALIREYELLENGEYAMAWSRCDTRFLAYVFPLPTVLNVRFPEVVSRSGKAMVINFTVAFLQSSTVVCESRMELTLLPARVAERVETRMARDSASRLLSGIAPNALARLA